MVNVEPIKIDGLAQFSRNLRKIDADLPKALRLANNDAGEIIVENTVPHVPRLTGKAQGSVKVRSTRTEARVVAGGKKVPWYPWLDFGGSVGRKKAVHREFVKDGRFMYPAYRRHQIDIQARLIARLLEVVEQAGIEVD